MCSSSRRARHEGRDSFSLSEFFFLFRKFFIIFEFPKVINY